MSVCLFIKPVEELLTGLGLEWVITALDIILIFVIARIAVGVVYRVLQSISARQRKRLGENDHALRRTETAITLMTALVKYAVYFIAIALSIGELGLGSAMASMLAAAGIGTLAIGIGAQSLIGDITTGLFMLFEDQIAVGDYVILAGVEGIVKDVSLRTVTVEGFTGENHIIPNGQIKEVTNFSRTDYIAYFEMEVSREADADRALDIMMEEMQKVYQASDDPAKKPPERVGIAKLLGNTMTLRVTMRCSALNQWSMVRTARLACNRRFVEENIPAPTERTRIFKEDA